MNTADSLTLVEKALWGQANLPAAQAARILAHFDTGETVELWHNPANYQSGGAAHTLPFTAAATATSVQFQCQVSTANSLHQEKSGAHKRRANIFAPIDRGRRFSVIMGSDLVGSSPSPRLWKRRRLSGDVDKTVCMR